MKRIDISMLVEEETSVEELKEQLWAFKRDSNALAVSVRYDPEYRSNPNNAYHDHYQRAINRQFSLFIHIFPMLWAWIFYGYAPAIAFTVGTLVVYVGIVMFHMVREIFNGLLNDIKLFFIYGRH